MTRTFVVMGEPKGKARPRFNPYGGGAKPRTPEDTLMYENLIKWEYVRIYKTDKFPAKTPIRMCITAYYKIPLSATKRDKGLMLCNAIRPTKKPDIDNVVKVYADALNGVAYHDDTQIVELVCSKMYSDEPRVEITLSEAGTE